MRSETVNPSLHREAWPARACSGCGAWLTTGNETKTCWACEPSWSEDEDALLSLHMREEIGDAIARILTPEALAA